eukprot:6187318-Pleurochrysis_carterae.AAC.2
MRDPLVAGADSAPDAIAERRSWSASPCTPPQSRSTQMHAREKRAERLQSLLTVMAKGSTIAMRALGQIAAQCTRAWRRRSPKVFSCDDTKPF